MLHRCRRLKCKCLLNDVIYNNKVGSQLSRIVEITIRLTSNTRRILFRKLFRERKYGKPKLKHAIKIGYSEECYVFNGDFRVILHEEVIVISC